MELVSDLSKQKKEKISTKFLKEMLRQRETETEIGRERRKELNDSEERRGRKENSKEK